MKKADEFENKIKNEEIEIKKIEKNIETSGTNIKNIWENVKEYEKKDYDTEIKNAINTKISNDINVNNLKTKVETASETADKLIETYLAKDKTLKEMVNKDKLDEVFGVIKLLSEDAKAIELWNIRINFRGLIILALLASFVSFLIVLFHMFGIFNVIKSKMKKMF